MLNKLLSNKILNLIVALILACSLWVYVVNIVNEKMEVKINNVDITFEGALELKENRSLQIVESQVGAVNLVITCKRSEEL